MIFTEASVDLAVFFVTVFQDVLIVLASAYMAVSLLYALVISTVFMIRNVG